MWGESRQLLACCAVASSNTGGWVRRVGSAGGGRTYRRRRPVNYYGAIGLVVFLGLGSVALARYDYEHPTSKSSTALTGQPFTAALGFDACGSQLAPLQYETATQPKGISVLDGGAIWVNAIGKDESDLHRTLADVAKIVPGLTVTHTDLIIPKRGSAKRQEFVSGTTCPKGTPDAGKVAELEFATWPSIAALTPKVTTDPGKVTLTANLEVTVAFIPKGARPLRPPDSVIRSMITGATTATTTTTTTTTTSTSTTTTSTTTTTLPKK